MSCPESDRLRDALREHTVHEVALDGQVRLAGDPQDFKRRMDLFEEAKARTEAARRAFLEHRDAHGCQGAPLVP